jgi:hypothetical protein
MGPGEQQSNFALSDMAWFGVRHAACMQAPTGVQGRFDIRLHMHERLRIELESTPNGAILLCSMSSLHVLCESFMICKSSWASFLAQMRIYR